MAEKTKFLSGEILTATNLNQAFDEKLNKTSVDNASSIDIENIGITMESIGNINIEAKDLSNVNTSAQGNINLTAGKGINLELRNLGSSNENRINIVQNNKTAWVYRKTATDEIQVSTDSTKINFRENIQTPTLLLRKGVIHVGSNDFSLPNVSNSDTLLARSEIIPNIRTFFYGVSVISGTTTLNSGITDLQGEGINTLSSLYDKINDVMDTSNNYTSDKIYLIVNINNTDQTLKFCGKSVSGSTTYYYFNNTEYKIWINSTTGLVRRTGFNGASVESVIVDGDTALTSTDATSRISCYLDDNGNVVKVLSFYIMRGLEERTNRIKQLRMPISVDGFPLYEGSTPNLTYCSGTCGVSDRNNYKYLLDIEESSISISGQYLILNIDWSTRPSSPYYNGLPCMVYAEWI